MIVSLISGGLGYLDGARALGMSLRQHEPHVPRILLVEDKAYSDQKIRLAEKAGWAVRVVAPVRPKAKVDYYAKRWPRTFSKLHIWGIESERAVYIDADCLVVQPFWEQLAFRDFERIAACWVAKGSSRFNAGVMVIKPCKQLHEKFVDDVTNGDPALTHVAGSDQSYHNLQFPVWTQIPDRFNYRWWSVKPGNLAIAHIRPHPWSKKKPVSQYHKAVIEQWSKFLKKS